MKKKNKKIHLNEKSIFLAAKEKVHQDAISTIAWVSQDRIVTGSQDHSIKLMDVEKLRSIGTVLTKDSITTSIDFCSDRLITSH